MPTPAVATDLDGTLLRSDMTVSVRTQSALTSATTAGGGVIIAPARPPRTIRQVLEQLGDGGYEGVVVCANGALVYDPARDELIERRDFALDATVEIVRRLRDEMPEL